MSYKTVTPMVTGHFPRGAIRARIRTVSKMIKEHPLSTRHRAVGMVSGCMTQLLLPRSSEYPSAAYKSGWLETAGRNRLKTALVEAGRLAHPSVQNRLGQICPVKTPVHEESGKRSNVVVVVVFPSGTALSPSVTQRLQVVPEAAGQGCHDVVVPQLHRSDVDIAE